MRRAALLVLVLSACTSAQVDMLESTLGLDLAPAVREAMLAVPDVGERDGHCDEYRAVAITAGWQAATFDGWASRVMFRESRCDPAARSRTRDTGLMQLNDIVLADMRQRPGLWASALDALGHVPSWPELRDPLVNLIVARNLYAIRGAGPWR